MPIYRVDAADMPRPFTLKARSLSQAAAYADERDWRTRSITFVSEKGDADQKAELVLRDDYQPKSLGTKIELTTGRTVIGIAITILIILVISVLFGL